MAGCHGVRHTGRGSIDLKTGTDGGHHHEGHDDAEGGAGECDLGADQQGAHGQAPTRPAHGHADADLAALRPRPCGWPG